MRRIRVAVPLFVFLAVATVAAAFTVAELQQRASTLLSRYQTLYSQANACTGGTCTERSTIESDFSSAESQRTQLHADRSTLNPCTTCQELDSTLQSVDQRASEVAGIIEGWDGQG